MDRSKTDPIIVREIVDLFARYGYDYKTATEMLSYVENALKHQRVQLFSLSTD